MEWCLGGEGEVLELRVELSDSGLIEIKTLFSTLNKISCGT